jgi:hypothetical protein
VISLTGCAETVYRKQVEVYCPPIVSYSQEFNEDLADDLDALAQDQYAIPTAITDYAKLRDRIRRCEEERGKL